MALNYLISNCTPQLFMSSPSNIINKTTIHFFLNQVSCSSVINTERHSSRPKAHYKHEKHEIDYHHKKELALLPLCFLLHHRSLLFPTQIDSLIRRGILSRCFVICGSENHRGNIDHFVSTPHFRRKASPEPCS